MEDFDYKELFKYEQKHALKAFFIKGNVFLDLVEMNFFVKWFYFLKALICLLLKRFKSKEYGIMVIAYDEYSYPDGCSWSYVCVDKGFFKGWNIQMCTDGI